MTVDCECWLEEREEMFVGLLLSCVESLWTRVSVDTKVGLADWNCISGALPHGEDVANCAMRLGNCSFVTANRR